MVRKIQGGKLVRSYTNLRLDNIIGNKSRREREQMDSRTSQPMTIGDEHHEPPTKVSRALTHRGLTYKQDRFAKYVSEGHKMEDCFRMAYPSSKGRPTAQILADASKVKNHPKVKERIEEYIAKQERYSSYNPAKLRQVAIETIMSIAQNEKSRDGDRLKAAELLGKMAQVNLFSSAPDTSPSIELANRIDLEQKLRSLIAISSKQESIQVIDITPQSENTDS